MDEVRALGEDVWTSFRSLPTWVQVWVGWLMAVNLAGLARRDEPAGRTVSLGLLAWLVPNAAIVVAVRGMGKAMSLPHLLVYPVVVVSLVRRALAEGTSDGERRFAWVVAVTNGISTAFDLLDTIDWVRGDRGRIAAA